MVILVIIKTVEFMFAGLNMFWARLRLILARAVLVIITHYIDQNNGLFVRFSNILTSQVEANLATHCMFAKSFQAKENYLQLIVNPTGA